MKGLRLGLLARVTLGLVLLGALPLVVVLTNVASVGSTLERQAERLQISHARLTAERIEAFVQLFSSLLATAAESPPLGQDPAGPEATAELAALLQSRPDIAALQVVDDQGRQLARVQDRSWAEDIEQVLGTVDDDPSTGNLWPRLIAGERSLWLVCFAPVGRPGTATENGGTLRMVAQAGQLADIFRPEEIGGRADVALADLDGRVLAGSVPSLDAFPAPLVAQATSGALSGAGPFEGEEDVLGAYHPVRGLPWVIVSTQPRAQAEKAARELRRRALLAVGTALLLVGLLSAGAYSSVVKPIRRMVREQRRLAGLSGPATGSRAGSEIDQLRESFEALRQRMRETGEPGTDMEGVGPVFLGRYQLLSVIGEGGMGTVFRAWDPTLQRRVALKTLRLGSAEAPEQQRKQVETLLHEAVAAARVQHPNVVAVYDVVEEDDVGFLTMELVEGISLDQLLRGRGKLSVEDTAQVGRAVARGLAAAHAQGLVHQDVKPGNILLGEDGAVKVVDFGIARFLSALAPSGGKIFGTPGYLPPETLEGRGYSETGDIFALGVILYQCLTGRRPFRGKSPRQAMVSTLSCRPTPLDELVEGVPEEMAELVHGLMAKDPEARRECFQRLETVLGRFADDEPKLLWSHADLARPDPAAPSGEAEAHSAYLPSLSGAPLGLPPEVSSGDAPDLPAGDPAGS